MDFRARSSGPVPTTGGGNPARSHPGSSVALRVTLAGELPLTPRVLAPPLSAGCARFLTLRYPCYGQPDYPRSMLGRRFLLLVAVLMGLTALAASVAPREPLVRDRRAATPSPTPTSEPDDGEQRPHGRRDDRDRGGPRQGHGPQGRPGAPGGPGQRAGQRADLRRDRADRRQLAGDLRAVRRPAGVVPDRAGRGPSARSGRSSCASRAIGSATERQLRLGREAETRGAVRSLAR